jgi:glutathione S-transferase
MYTVLGTVRTRTARVLWMLEELGLPYEHIAAGPRSPEVRALNPAGKVPVLLAEGVAITDSTAILTFLADRHGRFTHPAGSISRAQQDSLTQFVLDEFDAVLWTASRHSFILPEEHRLPAIKDSLRWEFARSQTALVARLGEGPFLMGAAMTVPDLILTHCGLWAGLAKFPITEPRFAAYLERMRARPACLRAMAG